MPQPGLKEKICVDCKRPYQPTSNVQKRCQECGKKTPYKSKLKFGEKTPDLKAKPGHPDNSTKQPPSIGVMKPLLDMLIYSGCDSIEFVAGDICVSVHRVAK